MQTQKVVVFDIGDVLVFGKMERAGEYLKKLYNIPVEKTVDLFWGNGWGGDCLQHFLSLNSGTEEQFYQIAKRELSVDIPEAVFWKMWNQPWVQNEAIAELVGRLANLSEPPVLAICSNINLPEWLYLCSTCSVLEHFSQAALSYRVGKMKPHRLMFETVERQAPKNSTFLFIDDRIENIEAAKKFGWNTHHLDYFLDQFDPKNSLEELEVILKNFLLVKNI